MNYTNLFTTGYQKFKIDNKNLKYLNSIKYSVLSNSKKIINKKIKLDLIHKSNFNEISFNDFRLSNFKMINKDKKLHENLFNLYKKNLFELLGPDISVQKNVNFAIQRPNDQNRAPFHKDSPPNSPYELVIWLPLVDCNKTMSMYFFPISRSKFIQKSLSNKKSINLDSFSNKYGQLMNCKYGEFFIFLAHTFHYIPINTESKTRWSFNVRYKNTFSPYGSKGYLDFFEPIAYSEITNNVFKYTSS